MKKYMLHIITAFVAVALIVGTPYLFPNERHTGKKSVLYIVYGKDAKYRCGGW